LYPRPIDRAGDRRQLGMRGESPDVVIEFGELLARAPAHPAEAFVLRSDLGRVERLLHSERLPLCVQRCMLRTKRLFIGLADHHPTDPEPVVTMVG
jgi:hypothetical protein